MRTCIGCRSRAERSQLTRVVERAGAFFVDQTATAPGRGAWVHPTVDCVETAVTRRAFGRALCRTDADDTHLRAFARQLAEDHSPAPHEKAERTMDNS